MSELAGKPILHIADKEPVLHAHGFERESALDEVETFDEDDEDEGELVSLPVVG